MSVVFAAIGLVLGAVALDPSVMSKDYWAIWNSAEQAKIDADIEANRKADACVELAAPAGTRVRVEQLTHAFKFGAHIFNFNQLGRKDYNDAYKASYGAGGIFNSATVAFYWNPYEPIAGKVRAFGEYEDTERFWNSLSRDEAMDHPYWRRPAPGPVIRFCKEKNLRVHGHVLVWGSARPNWIYTEFCPENEKQVFDNLGIPRFGEAVDDLENWDGGYNGAWKAAWKKAYPTTTEREVASRASEFAAALRTLFRKRVSDVARDFAARVDSWDVVNESAVEWARYPSAKTDLPVWFSPYGLMPGDYPLHAFLDAQKALPARAKLNINDYYLHPDYIAEIKDLEKRGARIDIVGCQMHIFDTNECARLAGGATNVSWVSTPQKIEEILDLMSKANHPIHVSEVTIAAPGVDARSRQIQAILARNIFRKWFSHRSVMGITWWNTVDGGGVKGEPLVSGLFTADLRKKPIYDALDDLVNHEWQTRLECVSERLGESSSLSRISFRGFRGTYRLSWTDPRSGTPKTKVISL